MKRSIYVTFLSVLLLLLFGCGGDEVAPTPEPAPAPRVVSVSPVDGATNVPISARVWVVFSIPMDQASAEAAFVLETDAGDAVPGSFDWANENMVFTPATPLAEAHEHRVRITTDAKNLEGTPLVEGVSLEFATGTDVEVANVFPPNLARGVGTDTTVEVTFSDPMDTASVEEAFEMRSDLGIVGGVLTWNGATATFVPDEPLANATTYAISIARRAKEIGGSALRESFSSTFKTLATAPEVSGDRIADRPTWTWTAPDDRTGFRYQLDGTDGAWTTVSATVTSHAPTSTLADGAHTLFVQARYHENKWSASSEWTTVVGPILDGDLIVEGPDDLVDVRWLRVTGDVRIQGPGVLDVVGLERIREIDGSLVVGETQDLANLVGLDGLEFIGDQLRLSFNNSLASVEGLGNVERIGGFISVSMGGAQSLVGLESLTTIGGLSVFGAYLPNMSGLEAVTTIEGNLSCSRSSFDPTGFESLTTIGGDMTLDACSVTSTTGFERLTSIGGDLAVRDGSVRFDSLSNLERIEGNVRFDMAYGFDDMRGLDRLTSIGGDFAVYDGAPDSFVGLEALQTIGGDLAINMMRVDDLAGFEGLTTVGGDVDLDYLWNLANVDGLGALTEIGGNLAVASNMGLTSLTGFSALTALGDTMTVTNNMSLPTCEAENLRDRLVAEGWTGTAQIAGNDDAGTCD